MIQHTASDLRRSAQVNIVQESLPAAIPIEACYLGWQQSLNLLAMLVEPEIKD